MSTPESLNPAPLTSLGDHSFKKVFEDDYSTGKLNLKLKANTQNSGSANYKGWLDITKMQSKQETKFQFPLKNYTLQIATRDDGAKIHVDFGQVAKLSNGNVSLFANAKLGSQNIGNAIVRFGGVTKWNAFINHLRLEYNPSNTILNGLARIFWKNNEWTFVAAEDIQINGGFGIRRLDFIVGYLQPNYDVYFRHLTSNATISKPFSKLLSGKLILDFVYRQKQQTLGIENEYNLEKAKLTTLVGITTKLNGLDVKARINTSTAMLGLSGKGKFNEKFNWTFSTELPLGGQWPKKQGVFPIPVGFTIDTSL
ncbi:unnamed protein product [Paramecium pentaurelia]|uniref:Uncharacterized protein n=1 Tax=Paramecium pentaurelia TaxID=43138 RepID=A0A8S1Y8Y3_9CILI|nr:unnamed protein product [Paramecium pentaurelia]